MPEHRDVDQVCDDEDPLKKLNSFLNHLAAGRQGKFAASAKYIPGNFWMQTFKSIAVDYKHEEDKI